MAIGMLLTSCDTERNGDPSPEDTTQPASIAAPVRPGILSEVDSAEIADSVPPILRDWQYSISPDRLTFDTVSIASRASEVPEEGGPRGILAVRCSLGELDISVHFGQPLGTTTHVLYRFDGDSLQSGAWISPTRGNEVLFVKSANLVEFARQIANSQTLLVRSYPFSGQTTVTFEFRVRGGEAKIARVLEACSSRPAD